MNLSGGDFYFQLLGYWMLLLLFGFLAGFSIWKLRKYSEQKKRAQQKNDQPILIEDLPIHIPKSPLRSRPVARSKPPNSPPPPLESESPWENDKSSLDDNLTGKEEPEVPLPSSGTLIPKEKVIFPMIPKKEPVLEKDDYFSKGKRKWIWIIVLSISAILVFIYLIALVNQLWPRNRFSPEVDAAFVNGIVTSFVSMFTIVITVSYTVYTSRKSTEAMMNQSRASIRDEFLKQRIKIYPMIQRLNRNCRRFMNQPSPNKEELNENLTILYEYYMEHKLYISKQIRDQIGIMFTLCKEENLKWSFGDNDFGFIQSSLSLDDMIDQELDLVAIDRDIRELASRNRTKTGS